MRHAILAAAVAALASPAAANDDYLELRGMLEAFVGPDADQEAALRQFEPEEADYRAAFADDVEDRAIANYGAIWKESLGFGVKPGQTEIRIYLASVDELREGTGNAWEFAGGYKEAAAMLEPGHTIYAVKFVKPGEPRGMALAGFQKVNDRWVVFPKPWRFLGE